MGRKLLIYKNVKQCRDYNTRLTKADSTTLLSCEDAFPSARLSIKKLNLLNNDSASKANNVDVTGTMLTSYVRLAKQIIQN